MKKLLILIFIFGTCLSGFAKSKPTYKEIKIGSSQDEVKQILGKPRIITLDYDGNHTWIYENDSTNQTAGNAGFGQGKGIVTTIVKFDNNHQLINYSYHKSVY